MKSIATGIMGERERAITLEILEAIHERVAMTTEEEGPENSAFCDVLRNSRGGYSRRRFRHHKPIKSGE